MPPLLEARSLTKSFPGVRALKGVSLTVQRGEVLAVIGENGAGKSTLMKILAGVQPADTGEILLDGQPIAPGSVHDALANGIALIHQEGAVTGAQGLDFYLQEHFDCLLNLKTIRIRANEEADRVVVFSHGRNLFCQQRLQ